MTTCAGCGKESPAGASFCPTCGMPTPARKAAPGTAAARAAGGGAASGGSAPEGTVMPELAGNYEYLAPGSAGKKTAKYLTLNADGSATFREEGETSLEKYTVSGSGHWHVLEDSCIIRFPSLKKENTLKKAVLVPGFDASHTTTDDGFDVDVDKLLNAPGHGVHKWRKA